MNALRAAFVCALASSALAAPIDTVGEPDFDLTNIPDVLNNVEVAFRHWLSRNSRPYSTGDPIALAERMDTFKSSAEFVYAHNQAHPDTVLHLNEFADMSFEEFKATHLGYNTSLQSVPGPGRLQGFRHAGVAAPAHVDWTTSGAVTGVKNQGQCGSCWAFSTTGAIEGVDFIETGKLKTLSEQELVDCDNNGDAGCNGGLMDHAFDYVIKNGGLDTETDYQYWGSFSFCNRRKEADRHVVTISGFEDVPVNDEAALAKAVAAQPVSVAICANRALQLYQSGVFDGDCCTALNHGVLAVGYGKDDGGDEFWKVKNSWGPGWGEKGFFRLKKDLGGEGQCGIAMVASYPVKDEATEPQVPTICDAQMFSWWECPYGTICSCDFNLLGLLCLSYECEPNNAVSCGDGESFCPSEAPKCDTNSGRCSGQDGLNSPIMTAVPAHRRGA